MTKPILVLHSSLATQVLQIQAMEAGYFVVVADDPAMVHIATPPQPIVAADKLARAIAKGALAQQYTPTLASIGQNLCRAILDAPKATT